MHELLMTFSVSFDLKTVEIKLNVDLFQSAEVCDFLSLFALSIFPFIPLTNYFSNWFNTILFLKQKYLSVCFNIIRKHSTLITIKKSIRMQICD